MEYVKLEIRIQNQPIDVTYEQCALRFYRFDDENEYFEWFENEWNLGDLGVPDELQLKFREDIIG